eukprot:5760000-Lingulodinium_polyedra.AAC.1
MSSQWDPLDWRRKVGRQFQLVLDSAIVTGWLIGTAAINNPSFEARAMGPICLTLFFGDNG